MKAIIFDETGPSSVLKLAEIPTPTPNLNQVLIRLKTAALNHVDLWVRKGSPAYPVILPHVLGCDGAGVVEAMGPEAEGVSIGDRVLIFPALSCGTCQFCKSGRDNQCDAFEILGTKHRGTYAEFVAVPDQNVVPIPENISFEDAAAFPLVGLTAWQMLVTRANIKAKETILVVGASSGIGTLAIQIAKLKKAIVLAVTSAEGKVEKLKALGADAVFVEKENTDFSSWARQFTNGNGVDVVVEHVGPATWEKSFKSLAKYGRLVTCGATTGSSVELELRPFFGKNISLLGSRMGTQKDFRELCTAIFSKQINPPIDKIFPLEQAKQAHDHMEGKTHVGKIILQIS